MKKNILLILFSILISLHSKADENTWANALRTKKSEITIYYRLNEPFLIADKNQSLSGLEYEMMIGFKYYLLDKYGIKINYDWIELENLKKLLSKIETNKKSSEFGLDIISWTPERHRRLKYSSPYFPDIQVLITHRDNPTALAIEEFNNNYSDASAITIKGTTYERSLYRIKKESNLNFNIEYLSKNNDLIGTILDRRHAFGYVDLTMYLLALERNEPVKRLNMYPFKGRGLGLVFNKISDWNIPFDEYLASPDFSRLKEEAIVKYLGPDFTDFIANLSISENEEIVLLNQEKKFMDMELTKKSNQAVTQAYIRNFLIVCIILVLTIAYFLFNRNKIKTTANEVLTLHRKMIESQNKLLSKRNDELVEVNEEKNNFIHILSHDLRAPINNITGLSKLLLMEAEEKLDSGQTNMIEHIASESRRLNKMVTRILDIERIESNKIEEYRKIDLYKVVRRVIENYKTQAESKGIEVLEELVTDAHVLGLEQYFFHVFENLLSNALKFSPINKKVKVQLDKLDNYIEVKVIDEGPGMSEDDKKKMFKKFQVLSAKATAGERSTGLGLSIVDKYINLLNGELICESELGHGTTFIARFSAFKEEKS